MMPLRPTLLFVLVVLCAAVNVHAEYTVLSSLRTRLPSNPRPAPQVLKWHEGEINALIHFNMATFVKDGDPGCTADNWSWSGKPSNFAPSSLDTDDWVESFKDLGVKGAVLTAKHGCGFLLWPSKTVLPNGEPYGYRVGAPTAYGDDVLARFVKSTSDAGIGHGFYYSLTNNFYLNVYHHAVQNSTLLPGQAQVTQAQWEKMALEHLTELWTNYGNLTEIWFDGGYTSDMQAEITSMLNHLQPGAVAFGGAGVSSAPACWVGTESGDAPDPTWSTGTGTDGGDPNDPYWCPKECDTTLQEGDAWFWMPNTPIRTLKELISVYHTSVGRNGVLEIDYAIDRTGRVDPAHKKRYKEFGDWIRACYDKPVAETTGTAASIELPVPTGSTVDRVVVSEDQAFGQNIRSYTIQYRTQKDGALQPFSQGTSVGNKKIDLHNTPLTGVYSVVLTVTAAAPGTDLHIRKFAVYAPCPSE